MLKYLVRKGELAIGKIQAWAGARLAPGICQTPKAKEFYLCLVLCSLREEPVFSTDDQQRGEENQTPTTSQKIRYAGQFSLYFMHVLSLGPISNVTCILNSESEENWGSPQCQHLRVQLPGELQALPWVGGMAGAPSKELRAGAHPDPYRDLQGQAGGGLSPGDCVGPGEQ